VESGITSEIYIVDGSVHDHGLINHINHLWEKSCNPNCDSVIGVHILGKLHRFLNGLLDLPTNQIMSKKDRKSRLRIT